MIGNNFEIGSEFWDVPVCETENYIIPSNTEWFVSGRSALKAIIKDIKTEITFNSAALPSWCCDSMIIPFLEEGINVEFYPVYLENGKLKKDFTGVFDCDAILIMDYFGYKRQTNLDFDGIVIRDITHSVFCNYDIIADYTFGSFRKWAGFYTGGFAFKKNGFLKSESRQINSDYVELRRKAMQKKNDYINRKNKNKDFLNDFACAEEMLEEFDVMSGCAEDVFRAKRLDIDFIKQRRRKNAQVLLDELSDLAIFPELAEDDCPLFVPLVIPNSRRDELRQYLITKQIYCPIHWPLTNHHKTDDKSMEIYQKGISIVCDQRYDENDMRRICFEIKSFLNLR